MKKRKSTMPFNGTNEQKAKLQAYLKEHAGKKDELISVMQYAQDIYGYLPIEVQSMIAQGLDIPIEEVYGVATFYAQFSLTPKGKYRISVCLGTACYVKGAQALIDRISARLKIKPDECTQDMEFSLEACRCIGACGLAPVLTINDDVYGKLEESDIDDILDKYIKEE